MLVTHMEAVARGDIRSHDVLKKKQISEAHELNLIDEVALEFEWLIKSSKGSRCESKEREADLVRKLRWKLRSLGT